MAISFNGTTAFLEYADKLVSSYPCSMAVWGTRTSSGGDQFWISQTQTTGDRYIAGWHFSSSDGKAITSKVPGGGDTQYKTTTPHTSSSVLKLLVVVWDSASSKTVYFGDDIGLNNVVTTADNLASHNACVIGARHYNNTAASNFANGSLAEAHWFNVALTAADVANMIADTIKPEAISGWVDGWTLKDYEAGGTYTSIGGTRTMTAVGGVSSSALTHPLSRASTTSVSSDLAASYGITGLISSDLAASYSIDATGQVSSNLAASYGIIGSISSNLAASYTIAAPTASIVFDDPADPGSPLDFGKNTAAYYFESAAVTVYFNLASTNALIAAASLTTNADATLDDYANAAFVSGTSYRCVFKFADGSEGMVTLAAA
jgi:hypothetical protein